MEYYKKYRIIENISLTESINHFIDFVHRIPLIGKLTGDKYKLFAFKNFVYMLGPIFSIIGQALKSIFSFFIALAITGFILWLIKTPGNFTGNRYEQMLGLALENIAFLSFYLTPAFLSNGIDGNKEEFYKLNYLYKMPAKATGLILGVFNPLRVAFGRFLAFCIFLSPIKAFLISFILGFVRITSNTYNLKISSKKEKKISDRFIFVILVQVILFALLMRLSQFSNEILIVLFIICLTSFGLSIKSLFAYDKYDRLLEVAKRESSDIDLDYDKIANDSLALKDSDIVRGEKPLASGYELLNNLFFQRHRRLLIKPIFKKSLIIFAIIVALLIGVKFIFTNFANLIEGIFILALPIIAMIIFNDTESARAFFLNCDRSLMQYGFYRDPKAIFTMYKLRYKTLLKVHLTGLFLGIVSIIIYYFLYQNIDIKTVLLAGSFIVFAYLFFPAFNLFNYYVFQPFNHDASAKGEAYKFVNSLIGYVNILIIPATMGSFDGDMKGAFIILIFIMMIMILIFPFIVKKYGKERFKIRK